MVRLRTAIGVLTVFGLCVLAAAVFTRIYSGTVVFILLTGAALAATVVASVLRLTRVSMAVSIGVSLATLIGYLLLAVVATRESGSDGVGALFIDAVRNSGARILTSTIPVLPTPDTVALPIVVVWIATLVGVELVLRTSALVPALVAPTVVYVVSLVLVGPNAKPGYATAIGFVALCLFALLATSALDVTSGRQQLSNRQRRQMGMRQVVTGGVGMLAFLGVIVLIGPWAAQLIERQPVDPRAYVAAPEQQLPETNPLSRLAGWAARSGEELFTVRMNDPSRIRWVVLTDYDGLTWTPERRYRSAGAVLPIVDKPSAATEILQEYTVQNLTGVWLPAVDQPREVTGVRVSYDAVTGSLLQPIGVQPELRYQVVSQRPEPSLAAIEASSVPTGGDFRRYTQIGAGPADIPADMRNLATEVAGRGISAYERALLIERYLLANFTFSAKAPSGHDFPSLGFFLGAPAAEGGHRGTSEQFAATFALLARIMGLPTRVVVGFHAGVSVGDQQYQVHSGDAFAWPEIYFTGHGWVPFDPTPAASKDAEPPPEEATTKAKQRDKKKAEKLKELDDRPKPSGPPAQPKPESKDTDDDGVGWLVVSGGAGLLAVGVLAGIWVARLVLRWRRLVGIRSRGVPGDRVIGAWREVIDALCLAGRAPPVHFTATDMAHWAHSSRSAPSPPRETRVSRGPSLVKLAELVNMVWFAPALATPTDGQAAVIVAKGYVRMLRREQPWWRRLTWAVDPRPLFWARSRRHSHV